MATLGEPTAWRPYRKVLDRTCVHFGNFYASDLKGQEEVLADDWFIYVTFDILVSMFDDVWVSACVATSVLYALRLESAYVH